MSASIQNFPFSKLDPGLVSRQSRWHKLFHLLRFLPSSLIWNIKDFYAQNWPRQALRIELPECLGGVAIFGVLYFLSPAEREALWRQLSYHLPSGGLIITESGNGPNALTPTPLRLVTDTTKDGIRYERWTAGDVETPGSGVLRNMLRTFDGDCLVEEITARHPIYHLPQEQREAEIRASGLFDLVLLKRTSDKGHHLRLRPETVIENSRG
ncbi:MAG: hypothetical protein ACRCWS_07795 [Propionibacteriaceae bacterium]